MYCLTNASNHDEIGFVGALQAWTTESGTLHEIHCSSHERKNSSCEYRVALKDAWMDIWSIIA